jgi:hypothetical protein
LGLAQIGFGEIFVTAFRKMPDILKLGEGPVLSPDRLNGLKTLNETQTLYSHEIL